MTRLVTFSFALFFVLPIAAFAQQAPSLPEPKPQHAWLEKFVGEWTLETHAKMAPNEPPMEGKGTWKSRKLGGFWVLNEMNCDMAGDPMTGIQTLGFDAAKQKYVGTWVDSMTDFMWKYEGSLDKSEKILTLEADGPSFVEAGKMTKFHDIYEFKSPDELLMTSKMLGTDGKWVTFMTGVAKRKK